MGLATVIVSYSRAAIFSVLIIFFYLLVHFQKWLLILFFSLIVLFGLLDNNIRSTAFEHLQRGHATTDINELSSGRIGMWRETLQTFGISMIVGRGYAVGFRNQKIEENTNAHNSLLELYAGTGMLGAAVWLYIILAVYIRLEILKHKQCLKMDCGHVTATAVMLYILLSSITNVRVVYLDVSMILFVVIMIYIEKVTKTEKTKTDNKLIPFMEQTCFNQKRL